MPLPTRAPQRSQYVLDGVHSNGSFADCRGALHCLQIFDSRVDRRLVLQVLASEFNPVIDWGGVKFEGDLFTGVQCGAAKAGGFADGLLKLGCSGHARLTSRDFVW